MRPSFRTAGKGPKRLGARSIAHPANDLYRVALMHPFQSYDKSEHKAVYTILGAILVARGCSLCSRAIVGGLFGCYMRLSSIFSVI